MATGKEASHSTTQRRTKDAPPLRPPSLPTGIVRLPPPVWKRDRGRSFFDSPSPAKLARMEDERRNLRLSLPKELQDMLLVVSLHAQTIDVGESFGRRGAQPARLPNPRKP